MREHDYQRRLKRDLEEWVSLGKISQKAADDITSDLPASKTADRLPTIIAILGAVLICVGILAFVAANWYGVSKAARLALIAAGMWAAYGCAGVLYKRGHVWLFEAIVLIGVSIYATGIVLIAQMYHMDGHYPDAIFMVGAGALIAAWLLRSTSSLVIAIAAFTLWTGMEVFEFNVAFHWPFIIVWCCLAAISYHMKSQPGYHLTTLSFGYWTTVTVFDLLPFDGGALALLASLYFFVLAVALFLTRHRHKETPDTFASSLSVYAVTALVVLICLLQIVGTGSLFAAFSNSTALSVHIFWLTGTTALVAIGILISIFWRQKIGYSTMDISGIILIGVAAPLFGIIGVDNLITLTALATCLFLISLWLIVFGQNFSDIYFVNLGFVLFGVETLYVYFKAFGTFMDSFVFFTIGGIILIILALGLDRFRKRILNSPAHFTGEK